jgi:hypothetical protein
MSENEIGNVIIAAAMKVHSALGPGLRGQLSSYLRLGGFKLGYLLNFNVAHMRDGIPRMVNGL